MKIFYKSIFIVLIGFCFQACDYLDVVPDNVATIDYAFRNRTEAEKFLFTCYNHRPRVGSVDIDPAMNGGDETWQFYPIAGWQFADFVNSNIARGFQNTNDPILNFWDAGHAGSGLWIGIRDCNILLENIEKVPDLSPYEKKRWIAEAKFLKAYYHYYLFRCYGPIPIVDINLPISASIDEVQVYREPVDKIVEYIVDLMAESITDLPEANEIIEGTEAGRIDKLVALSMRAEVLLFAASPLFNGNQDYANLIDNRQVQLFPKEYDAEKWRLAADACKEAIDAAHEQHKALYDLIDPLTVNSPAPFQLEVTYRNAICDRWNKELLWGNTNNDCNNLSRSAQPRIVRLTADILNAITSQWAPTMKMAEMYYSSNGVPITEDKEWLNKSWYEDRFKIRTEPSSGDEKYYVKENSVTAYLHYNREPRFYASIGFDQGIYYGNGYYDFPSTVKYCNFLNFGYSGYQGGSAYSITGYAAKKMHSFKNTVTPNNTSVEYYPFPIMRMANLYLMYAEALNEYSGPSDEIFKYIDLIRERAGLDGVKDSWSQYSSNPNKPNSKEGLREIIHHERTIELAFEGKRFWDLRRWKEINVLNDQPRGWNVTGETPEDFYRVVNVAKQKVNFGVKDYFWPIRESNLSRNTNLIQNYGW
ncbi:MAG: RagB/SusD family nutrient uptake outer membrane protein [Candidatus Saccharimonadaceae bacterium]